MKTIYLNARYNSEVETIDEFTQSNEQTLGEFKEYVNRMNREYNSAGIPTYKSQKKSNK
jgi:hypothetical protein